MKNYKLKFGVFLSFFSGVVLFASSSVDRKLDECRGDITCMSKVLAQLIEDTAGNSNNNNNGPEEYVEFYHDDGRCDPAKLMIKVRIGTSENRCRTLATTVSDSVWGIKIEGRCSDIGDVDFMTACTTYASTKNLNRAKAAPKL